MNKILEYYVKYQKGMRWEWIVEIWRVIIRRIRCGSVMFTIYSSTRMKNRIAIGE